MNPTENSVRVLMVRHGETSWNSEARFIGTTDLPLNKNGWKQTHALATALSRVRPHALYTSRLQRAAGTASVIGKRCRLDPQMDDRLIEYDYGMWEGLTLADIQLKFPAEYTAWLAGVSVPSLGMESIQSLHSRADQILQVLRENHAGQTVIIVAHGFIQQMIIFRAVGLPWRNEWLFYMFNGSISELWLQPDSGVLVRLNDTHHLPG